MYTVHRSDRQKTSPRPTVFPLAQPGALCPSVSLQPLPPGPSVSRKLSFLRCHGKNGPVSYQLPHCYVIADPIRPFVLYSATSAWHRPCQPYLASCSDLHPHPELCEKATTLLGRKPKIQGARETKSTLPYCPFWEGPGCSLHLRAGGRRIPGVGGREIAAFCSCSIPSRRQRRRHHCLAEVFACLCVFGFSFSEW